MTIDWQALGLVCVVTLGAGLLVVTVVAIAVRAFSAATDHRAAGKSAMASQTLGSACLVVAAGAVLFGLYLIVPQFH